MLGGHLCSSQLYPLACRDPSSTALHPRLVWTIQSGETPQVVMVHSTLTYRELAEHSLQTLSFRSTLVQRQLQTLPAHAGLNLPPISCQMCSWRVYSPVSPCQHCCFSSRPLLSLQCLPCYIYNFLIRLSKPKDSCLLFFCRFGPGGKPLVRCFPQVGAGASLWLCFSPF